MVKSEIPKIIHLCWLSGDRYPEKIEKCISSWKKNLNGYEIILWDKNKFDLNSVKWVKESYENKMYAFASDYIRFYALYYFGGIYLDSDVEIIKSFDDLLNCRSFIGYEFTGVPEAAVIGAMPKQKWIKECLDFYKNKSFFDKNGKMNRVVLPMILKAIYEKFSGVKMFDNSTIQIWDDNYIYPYQYFSPRNTFSKKIELNHNTYAIHHFNASWLSKSPSLKQKKNIHVNLLKFFGRKNYLKLLYFIRTYIKNVKIH